MTVIPHRCLPTLFWYLTQLDAEGYGRETFAADAFVHPK